MPRYRIDIEYDGTDYCGWQRQHKLQELTNRGSVQAAIEQAIFNYSGESINLVVAGRTDAGVHAMHQVAHFDMSKIPKRGATEISFALNAYLRRGLHKIAILNSNEAKDDFSARFSAQKRQYLYRIIIRRAPLAIETLRAWHIAYNLNIEAMKRAAKLLYGKHDFSSFRSSQCQAKNPIRTLEDINFILNENRLDIIVTAPSFLHNQVRAIIGTLYNVGRGFWSPEYITTILKLKDRNTAGPNAPPYGLYLYKIHY